MTAISITGFGNILNSIVLLFDGPFIPVTVLNVNPAIDAAPPGVVTLTLPDAPAPTTAVILVAELTVNEVAGTPPKLTAVTPVKFVPVITIDVPALPLVGVNEVIVGAGMNVKPMIDVVPPGVIILTLPVAPAPTTAVILVAELTVNEVAATPPKLTAVAPLKFVPVIVIDVPAPPLDGENDVIVGAGMNVKPVIDTVPPGVITLTLPDAPVPTTAVMLVAELTVTEDAVTPPKFTTVTPPVKFVPVIVIAVPSAPLDGLNEVIVGREINVKPGNVAVPPEVVTLILPVAPVPTTAVMLVAELTVNEEAATPPKVTDVAPARLAPVIVIDVPVPPFVGVKEVIVGEG